MIQSLFTPFLFQSTAQAITPILFAALAGVLCGRVGVFNLALEGQMLVGAFAAIVGSYFGHSALVGVAAGMAAAAVFSLILGYGATIFRGDPVVIGIGMNLLAAGLTAYLLRVVFGVSGTFSDPNVVGLGRITIPALVGVPVLGWAFGRQSALTFAALGADRADQRRSVPDSSRTEAARRRRAASRSRGAWHRRRPLPERDSAHRGGR